jgi:tetraacyldisaccharide 4'-kinase
MTPLEFLYYIGYSLDKRYKLKHQKRLPHKVISIGNITVGGTGKTPATIAIAEEAKKRGFQPIILTRGYKGKAKGPCLVNASSVERQASSVENQRSVAQRITHHASRLYGDEPILMAERLQDVPIVKCSDRYEGGKFAIENLKSQISNPKSQILFILDDGFQHRQLHRDVDIVLIDGENPFGNRRMLPIGPMREPLNELKRADIFVVTKTPLHSPLTKGGIRGGLLNELKEINPSAPVYVSVYRIHKVRALDGNEYPVEMLMDKKIYAFCGIANPESFKQTVLSLYGKLSGFKAYRDHHRYSESDVLYLQNQCKTLNCDFLLATEKDMVKIREIKVEVQDAKELLNNILCMEIGFAAETAFFNELFKNIP